MPAFGVGCDDSNAKVARVDLLLRSSDTNRLVSQSLEVVVAAP
jgi:hypothetical protein